MSPHLHGHSGATALLDVTIIDDARTEKIVLWVCKEG